MKLPITIVKTFCASHTHTHYDVGELPYAFYNTDILPTENSKKEFWQEPWIGRASICFQSVL